MSIRMNVGILAILALSCGWAGAQVAGDTTRTLEVPFRSHDGHDMFGKLVLPTSPGNVPVIVYVQTAEGMTVDVKRPGFNYFDLYRKHLPAMNVGFFSYEGRGIKVGNQPSRYETIDRAIYDTSTLENKVRDCLSAIEVVKKQAGVDAARIWLMGTSEGTLLAAETASRAPGEIAGLVLYAVMPDTMRETFKYIMSDGGYLAYRGFFDTDQDGKISLAEFEADPKQYRARVFRNAPFTAFDKNGDGFFTVDEMSILTKPLLDAIANDDFVTLDNWAKTAAGVSTPAGWFKDHFNHPPIWTYLEKLDMPMGLFHGTLDTNTPVSGVRAIEARAKAAGKTKMKFYYIEGTEHSLGIGPYFSNGVLPDGHTAIFGYIRENVATPKR